MTNTPPPAPATPLPPAAAQPVEIKPRPVPPGPAARRAPSITDFLTDGSLSAVCEELQSLTGIRVQLLDPTGRPIVYDGIGPKPWRLEPQPLWAQPPIWPSVTDPKQSAPVVEVRQGDIEWLAIGMVVDGVVIGSLALTPPAESPPVAIDPATKAHLTRAAAWLATVAADFCRQELDLKHRVQEIQALYRISSMLTRATSLEALLQTSLDSALEVLELDAGAIVLFERDEGPSTQTEVDIALKASRNLSRTWLDNPLPLSKDRVFDRLALAGEIVISEDLWKDPRVLLEKEVRGEGLRAAIHAGLVVRDRAIGIIRLYARRTRGFGESERRLIKSIAHQAAVAVEQSRLLKSQERETQVQRQLQLAADVQRRMLPRTMPNLPRLDVAARYVPSLQLSGDFYDFIDLPEGNLGVTIGDVVGKGIAAALLMASVRASLRAHVQDVYHIDDVVQRVNSAMCRDTRDNEFATLWYGVIDRKNMKLTYVAAGHDPPMVVRVPPHRPPTLADVDELSTGGMAVGIDASQRYQRGTYDLQTRDVLVAYTDGVTDVMNFDGKRFGRVRLRQALLELLAKEPEAPASKVLEHVLWSLRQFAGLKERPDDQTVVVLRVK